jgi:hypothetical protein
MMKRLFLRERMWNWVYNDSPIFNEKRGSKTDSIIGKRRFEYDKRRDFETGRNRR